MCAYSVKTVFLTLQGEGYNTGRPAVFCRFAGCNLWNGLDVDRASAACRFCDTDFVGTDGPGGGKYRRAAELVKTVVDKWGSDSTPFVVLTGGEPTLQVDMPLIAEFRRAGCQLAIETNGTRAVPTGIDWICVSPKAGVPLVQQSGNEIKVPWPQLLNLDEFERLAFTHRYLQPIDGPNLAANTRQTIEMCIARPTWRLSTQVHKFLGIP